METVELERFLALVDELGPEDWSKPTACTRWEVRQIVAHLVAEADIYSNFAEFRRQANSGLQQPYRDAGMSRLDAMNQMAVDDRADLTSAQLIAQLRERRPRSIRTRQRLPALLRHLPLPLGKVTPELGRTWVSIGYLTDLILPRDMWMHRLDISRATGKTMVLSPEHDGRITALAVRDLATSVGPKLERAVSYELTGPAGGSWRIGRGEPAARLVMDALDFHLLASGRLSVGDAVARVAIEGSAALARYTLERTVVPY
jgi:uncharacterized protein (TIGR03083 family)